MRDSADGHDQMAQEPASKQTARKAGLGSKLSDALVVCTDGSQAAKTENARYMREFGPAIVGYMITLTAVMFIVDADVPSARNYLVLLPVIPVAMAAMAVYRSVRRIDEYGRMLQVNGMAVGFGVSTVGLVALGLLATVNITPSWGPWLVFMAGMMSWALSSRLLMGRDR